MRIERMKSVKSFDKFNFCDIIIKNIFKKYTCKVYRAGIAAGFAWNKNVDKVNDLSTIHKI